MRTQQPAGSTRQYADFKSSVRIIQTNTNRSYTTGSGKSAVTHSMTGWATVGGMQAATGGNINNGQSGELWDGDNNYTTAAIPFRHFNRRVDSNIWLSAVLIDSFLSGFANQTDIYICFEGSGAQTTDTDWTTIRFKFDGEASQPIDYTSLGISGTLSRSSANSVYVQSNRVVYKYTDASLGTAPVSRYFIAGTSTAGYSSWIQFV